MRKTFLSIAVISIISSSASAGIKVIYKDKSFFSTSNQSASTSHQDSYDPVKEYIAEQNKHNTSQPVLSSSNTKFKLEENLQEGIVRGYREYIVKMDEHGNVMSKKRYITAGDPTHSPLKEMPQRAHGIAKAGVESVGSSKFFKITNDDFDLNSVRGEAITSSTNRKVIFRSISRDDVQKFNSDSQKNRSKKLTKKVKSFSINVRQEKKESDYILKNNSKVISPSDLFGTRASPGDYLSPRPSNDDNSKIIKNIKPEKRETEVKSGTIEVKKVDKLMTLNVKDLSSKKTNKESDKKKGTMVVDPNTLKPVYIQDDPMMKGSVPILKERKVNNIHFKKLN